MAASSKDEIKRIRAQIDQLQDMADQHDLDVSDEVGKLEAKITKLREKSYQGLTPVERVQLARHPQRPYTLDYVQTVFDDFIELRGDRAYRDDAAIVGGWARLDGRTVMVIGHQKGRDMKENLRRNFGMPHPEGYRKALRLMQLADKFGHPIVTLIDTPGAYPGIGAEERGQAEAIARNLREMARLKVPIIAVVIGEGGSGGALALG
ncbi:MAG TPA: acetyl-CoA carboxylase carboxyl transferase subunit alpha, partial [Longimicrobiales bacterium]